VLPSGGEQNPAPGQWRSADSLAAAQPISFLSFYIHFIKLDGFTTPGFWDFLSWLE
jgi:hypothetical protein